MNVDCMRAGSCEDKPGYLQNVEGGRDALTVQVAKFLHDKPDSVSRVNISQQEAILFPASCRHA